MRRLLTAAVIAVAALPGTAAPAIGTDRPATGLIRTDFHVSSDPGVRIAVREVRTPGGPRDTPPVLLLHGARVPGVASFDLPVAGGSLAADLARAGHRVYVMDARGYGGSTRPPSLAEPPEANPPEANPPEANPPAVRSNAVVRDIAAVVDRIGRGRQVALLGWATGGHWLGQYAAAYPDWVSRLVLYNTLYGPNPEHPTLGRGSGYEDPNRPGQFNAGRYGAYRLNTAESLLPSWDSSIPVEDKTTWRDPAVVNAYVRAALKSDPTSDSRSPASFRAPSGALEDSFYLATGRQLWDASLITAPTLILRSEYDFWSRAEDVRLLEEHLVHAPAVRAVELAQATHFAHLDRMQRGRGQFLTEVTRFLSGSH
ncbi:alpha/beta fold hydrolase [Saccharomonospora sp. NPDC046836]|uniref:alpha/beta hydrolase n=1 Tax=Saccharomonospora sp. NPDC046836 TaxID=3156921 RepID=UPI003401F582